MLRRLKTAYDDYVRESLRKERFSRADSLNGFSLLETSCGSRPRSGPGCSSRCRRRRRRGGRHVVVSPPFAPESEPPGRDLTLHYASFLQRRHTWHGRHGRLFGLFGLCRRRGCAKIVVTRSAWGPERRRRRGSLCVDVVSGTDGKRSLDIIGGESERTGPSCYCVV